MAKQAKRYVITSLRPMSGRTDTSRPLTVAEAVAYYGYTLECGVFYEREKGNKKINRNPKTIAALMSNLNKASDNLALNGCGDTYSAEEFIGEVVETA